MTEFNSKKLINAEFAKKLLLIAGLGLPELQRAVSAAIFFSSSIIKQ